VRRSAQRASRPILAGTAASIVALSACASVGAAPPVDTAITTGSRSMIAGTTKVESAALSTTLTGTPRA